MSPTPHVWIELFAAPALAGAAVFGAAGALAARRLSGRRQRAIWLTAFAALGWFLLGLGMGADRWLRSASVPSAPPVKRAFRVREAPVFLADASLTGEGAPVAPTVSAVAEPAYGWWPAWLWLGGAFLLLGRMGLQRLGWAITTRRARRPGTDALQARVEVLARRLGMRRRVRVFMSPELLSPAAWGVWRPVIMTPEDFASAQDERRQDAMLLHELAHLALHDPLWHTAARMVVAALWWHPLAWWGWNRLRAASEAAADEASVLAPDGPSELAAGLVALGAQLRGWRGGGLWMAGNGFRSGLGRRVQRLLALPAQASAWRASRGGGVGLAVSAAGVATLLLFGTAEAWPLSAGAQPAWATLARRALAQAAGAMLSKPAAASDSSSLPFPSNAFEAQPPKSLPSEALNGRPASKTALIARIYRINPFLVRSGLDRLGFLAEDRSVSAALWDFFAASGVDWGGTNRLDSGPGFRSPTGKTLLYREELGTLMVRATPADFEAIEKALNEDPFQTPPLVKIETRFFELSEKAAASPRFAKFFRKFFSKTNAAFAAKAAPRLLRGDQLDWPGRRLLGAERLRVWADAGRFLGVLTPSQFQEALRQLKRQKGATVMFNPTIITVSGRQAQIQSTELRAVVTGFNPAALADPARPRPAADAPPFLIQRIPLGPCLDVWPSVGSDKRALELVLHATVSEFLGYEESPSKAAPLKPPTPYFYVRRADARVRLEDGCTAALGMPKPRPGKLAASFVSAPSASEGASCVPPPAPGAGKCLLIFVTPVLTDPAGNPVHPKAVAPPKAGEQGT